MKINDVVKIGFWGLVGYYSIIKGLNQSSSNVNHNNLDNPILRGLVVNDEMYGDSQINQVGGDCPVSKEEIRVIVENIRNDIFRKHTILKPPTRKPSPEPQTSEAGEWLRLIRHPSIVIILGGRGKGKSVLGYRLLEILHWTASPWVVGLPNDARKYLPDYIGMAARLEDVPPNSIILVDEGYLQYHARRSMVDASIEMSQILNLSRQRNQTIIFVTQEARQTDKNVASSANVVIFKDLGILQLKFDRRELIEIATNAKQAFATIVRDKRRYAYVYSPDSEFMGLVENSLPTFWTERLSHIFATGGEVIARAPKKTPLQQRIEKAKELKRQGLSLRQIANLMGVSKGTVKNYLEGYPYKG